jgi:hypothetical protein
MACYRHFFVGILRRRCLEYRYIDSSAGTAGYRVVADVTISTFLNVLTYRLLRLQFRLIALFLFGNIGMQSADASLGWGNIESSPKKLQNKN